MCDLYVELVAATDERTELLLVALQSHFDDLAAVGDIILEERDTPERAQSVGSEDLHMLGMPQHQTTFVALSWGRLCPPDRA